MQEYGGPETLRLQEVPEPKLGPDALLVRVRAAGVNPVDYKIRQGYLDGAFPVVWPLVPGWDVAGVVERVGPGVTELAPGDEVMGYLRKDFLGEGTYAERVTGAVRHWARKPAGTSFAEAAGLPLAGLTAAQALAAAGVSAGDTVLVHAAGGGVGTFATQLARLAGARVLGTGGQAGVERLRRLGAEPVAYGEGLADRVRELAPEGVDAVLDLVGGPALEGSGKLVREPARVVSIVDAATVLGMGGRYVFVRPDPEGLEELGRRVEEGALRVEVAEAFPLAEAAEAHRRIEAGHVPGKLVLEV